MYTDGAERAGVDVETASQLLGMLVVNQSGWTDDAVDGTIIMIEEKWSDPEAAIEAIQAVVNSWTNQGRPPWAVLNDAYTVARRRRAMQAVQQQEITSGRPITVAEGRKVAARAYAKECRGRNPETDVHILSGFRTNEPNHRFVDRLLGFTDGT